MSDRRFVSEAEYRALLPFRMAKTADEINEWFAGILPEGMRFEWVDSGPEHGHVLGQPESI